MRKPDGTVSSSVFVTQKGNQMTRSEVREHIFRVLFAAEFCDREEFEDQIRLYFQGHEQIRKKQQEEISEKVLDLIANLDTLDREISGNAKAWNLARLGKAELSILRLAVYEILLDDQVRKK